MQVRCKGTHDGEPKAEIRACNVVWCPPNHKHWHGAMAASTMSHIAILEHLEGKTVAWMDAVSDHDYPR
jgi:quercetin dioxygenase-like cupin family protein